MISQNSTTFGSQGNTFIITMRSRSFWRTPFPTETPEWRLAPRAIFPLRLFFCPRYLEKSTQIKQKQNTLCKYKSITKLNQIYKKHYSTTVKYLYQYKHHKLFHFFLKYNFKKFLLHWNHLWNCNTSLDNNTLLSHIYEVQVLYFKMFI